MSKIRSIRSVQKEIRNAQHLESSTGGPMKTAVFGVRMEGSPVKRKDKQSGKIRYVPRRKEVKAKRLGLGFLSPPSRQNLDELLDAAEKMRRNCLAG